VITILAQIPMKILRNAVSMGKDYLPNQNKERANLGDWKTVKAA